MTIKDLLAEKGQASDKSSGDERSKLSDGGKEKAKSASKVLTIIKEAARKATEEVIRRRKAAAEELAKWRRAAREDSARKAAVEKAAGTAAETESDGIAAEEKAAKKAAKKEKTADETAHWVASSIRALGDNVELNDEDAVTAARNACDSMDWKCLKNITGAQIEYSLNKDFSDSQVEKIKMSYDLNELVKKLEPGKEYYVRIRLYAALKDKKHYSDWSDVLTLKT